RFGEALRFGLGRHRIHFGGIHQAHPARQGVIELLVSFGFGVLLAPGHGAQSDQADLEVGVAKFAVFQCGAPDEGFPAMPRGMPTMESMLTLRFPDSKSVDSHCRLDELTPL